MQYEYTSKLETLSTDDWQELKAIYVDIEKHKGPFSKFVEESEENENGELVTYMGYTTLNPVAEKLVYFFFNKKILGEFDGSFWKNHRKLIQLQGDDKYDNLTEDDVLKLFTNVLLGERFCDGLIGDFFDTGNTRILLKRLISFMPG